MKLLIFISKEEWNYFRENAIVEPVWYGLTDRTDPVVLV